MGLKIGHKIVIGFGLVIVLIVGLGWYQLTNIRTMASLASSIVASDFEMLRTIREIGNTRRDRALEYEYAWSAYLAGKAGLSQVQGDPAAHRQQWSLLSQRMRDQEAELQALIGGQLEAGPDPARRELLEQLREVISEQVRLLEETVVTSESVFALIDRDTTAGYAGLQQVLLRLRDEAAGAGEEAEALTVRLASVSGQAITDLHDNLRTISIAALAGGIVLALIVGLVLLRSITGPLREFMRFVERVGGGDLTQTLGRTGSDELGRLGSHLNEMVGGLNGIATQVRSVVENLNAAAAEMEASVQQNASGASEQNAAIQQITSTLGEITQSGAQIAERAKSVAVAAEAAAVASRSGVQAVTETSQAMDAIREQAEKVAGNVVALTEKTRSIGDIIATVKDLAERSNLLALNAAIEAAAAGEHGQSFAVVADEIKNLAGQAKEATAEVREILGDIQHGIGSAVMQTEEAVKRIEAGKQRAAATEQSINGLTRTVEQSVATFDQIVASMSQQQVGIEQVAQSVHGIREASEQMTAGSKDVGRAAAGIAALSVQLQRVAERYRV